MEAIQIEKGKLIRLGKFAISIGTFDKSEVAIISQSTGEFCKIKHIRKGGKLAKIKRAFKTHLCSKVDLCFSFMGEKDTLRLIEMLKK